VEVLYVALSKGTATADFPVGRDFADIVGVTVHFCTIRKLCFSLHCEFPLSYYFSQISKEVRQRFQEQRKLVFRKCLNYFHIRSISIIFKVRHTTKTKITLVLKGQSHKKVGKIRVWRGSLGPY
jgi:hypothetical protein